MKSLLVPINPLNSIPGNVPIISSSKPPDSRYPFHWGVCFSSHQLFSRTHSHTCCCRKPSDPQTFSSLSAVGIFILHLFTDIQIPQLGQNFPSGFAWGITDTGRRVASACSVTSLLLFGLVSRCKVRNILIVMCAE